MFSLFSNIKSETKGYKIADKSRSRKIGIAADSLKTLKQKASEKLNIPNCKLFLSSDGIEVDDESYFKTLPAQTLFIVAENNGDIKTDFDIILDAFKSVNSELLHSKDLINQFLQDDKNKDFLNVLQKVQTMHEEKVLMSSKSEHAEWFQGTDDKFQTKEEAMERRSQDRVRGYFYKTKDELTKSEIYKTDKNAKILIDNLIEDFFLFLNGVNYFSCFFNRKCKNRFADFTKTSQDDLDGTVKKKSATPRKRIKLEVKQQIGNFYLFKKYSVSLCNSAGNFNCHGIWFNENCSYSHYINPYASRENLIFFQTYNLDHQVEISRSIFPSILKNVQELVQENSICKIHKRKALSLSVITYFMEIFTVKNLRLVHIVCHHKGVHSLKSKGRLICDNCKEYKFLKKIRNEIKS